MFQEICRTVWIIFHSCHQQLQPNSARADFELSGWAAKPKTETISEQFDDLRVTSKLAGLNQSRVYEVIMEMRSFRVRVSLLLFHRSNDPLKGSMVAIGLNTNK